MAGSRKILEPGKTAPVQTSALPRDELFNEAEAALYLTVAARTLALWRKNGTPALPYVRIGRSVRYSRAELDKFIAKNTVGTPAIDACAIG